MQDLHQYQLITAALLNICNHGLQNQVSKVNAVQRGRLQTIFLVNKGSNFI